MGDIIIGQGALNDSETNSAVANSAYERYKALSVVYVLVYLCIGLVAVTSNSLVLYAAFSRKNSNHLKYLDDAIRSLAVTDLLFGLIAIPCKIVIDYNVGE